jgi:hypothetical protein
MAEIVKEPSINLAFERLILLLCDDFDCAGSEFDVMRQVLNDSILTASHIYISNIHCFLGICLSATNGSNGLAILDKVRHKFGNFPFNYAFDLKEEVASFCVQRLSDDLTDDRLRSTMTAAASLFIDSGDENASKSAQNLYLHTILELVGADKIKLAKRLLTIDGNYNLSRNMLVDYFQAAKCGSWIGNSNIRMKIIRFIKSLEEDQS